MPQLAWQKSSFSSGGEGNCVELAAAPPGHVHLRESDRPNEIATTAPGALSALLASLKSDGADAR